MIPTPEEKAEELFKKFWSAIHETSMQGKASIFINHAKKCALISVTETLECLKKYSGMYDQEFIDADIAYYVSVQIEIEKL